MLSKFQKAFPEDYKHVFTLLNTAEEHKKTAKTQLDTAKRMIKSHYDTKIKPMGNGDEGTMMCMFVSSDKQNNGTAALDTNATIVEVKSIRPTVMVNLFAEH